MIIKAISLKQPWASLVGVKIKTLETRTWGTTHRGPLLIVASKGFDYGAIEYLTGRKLPIEIAPVGAAICVADLIDCRRMVDTDEVAACCPVYPKARARELENIRPVPNFKVRGFPGLFNVDLSDYLSRREIRKLGIS